MFGSHISHGDETLWEKLKHLVWGQVFLICLFAGIGFTALYSAAGGHFDPWASAQMTRFLGALIMLVALALIDLKWVFRSVWILYGVSLVLLLLVDIFGHVGMGAQRWLDLGFIKIQPSELAKITTLMALARYFHAKDMIEIRKIKSLIAPALIIALPVALVVKQPDLGTGISIMLAGISVLLAAGLPMWIFAAGVILAVVSVPVIWPFLHDYQKDRVTVFFNPESEPLGAGFHIIQSKIALGSGGLSGKGFLGGTQSHLNFLPEKHTDFIFTLWGEEWGFLGGVALLGLASLIVLYGYWMSFQCKNHFGRILTFGLTMNFSIYIMVNIGMVMGLLPVVGIPLALMSYGGTAMLMVMVGFGLMQCCLVHRDARLPRG